MARTVSENHKQEIRRRLVADPGEGNLSDFPHMYNISAGFLYDAVPRPIARQVSEFVYMPGMVRPPLTDEVETKRRLLVAEWNTIWEAAEFRHEMFADRLPSGLEWLRTYRGRNVGFIPSEKFAYQAYAPLYHLMPRATLLHFGLPLLRRGLWPFTVGDGWVNTFLPRDFNRRFSLAFAHHIWPHLTSGSKLSSFSDDDSIKIVAHNLDFWIPYADRVVQEFLEGRGHRVRGSKQQEALVRQMRREAPSGVEINRPLTGGTVWCGDEEAQSATRRVVDLADHHGNLRALIDAIRSHRVEEDFSGEWSYAREDFERKLYRKRSKVKITFVQLDDTMPVHGPDAEVHENLLWEDFLSLLSEGEKRIVVCLRNGETKLGNVAKHLGYANHSSVSKALTRIRQKAKQLLATST